MSELFRNTLRKFQCSVLQKEFHPPSEYGPINDLPRSYLEGLENLGFISKEDGKASDKVAEVKSTESEVDTGMSMEEYENGGDSSSESTEGGDDDVDPDDTKDVTEGGDSQEPTETYAPVEKEGETTEETTEEQSSESEEESSETTEGGDDAQVQEDKVEETQEDEPKSTLPETPAEALEFIKDFDTKEALIPIAIKFKLEIAKQKSATNYKTALVKGLEELAAK